MPDSLDQYRLVEQIAATPDTVRYRAVRRDSAQSVEIQVFKTGNADRSRLSHRRVKLALMVHEPHVRSVLAYEPTADSLFLVLPKVSGRTLREELGTQLPLASNRALTIVSQIATALAAAHLVGLAHGSIAPEHVTITEPVSAQPLACRKGMRRESCLQQRLSIGFRVALK